MSEQLIHINTIMLKKIVCPEDHFDDQFDLC